MPKNFVGEPFSCVITSGNPKFFAKEGKVKIVCQKVFAFKVEWFRSGTVLCFGKFQVSKIFKDKKGEADSRVSVKISLSHCQKIS